MQEFEYDETKSENENAQRILDYVCEFMWKQNKRSVRSNFDAHGAKCVYRGPNKTKCAFGTLIPNSNYNEHMENGGVEFLFSECQDFLPKWMKDHKKMVSVIGSMLQKCHDISDGNDTFREEFFANVKKYFIDYPSSKIEKYGPFKMWKPPITKPKKKTQKEMFYELFDFIYKQGQSTNGKICLYRSDDGKKCAAGFFMTDEEYDSKFENTSIDLILAKYGPLTNINKSNIGFIEDMQLIHDNCDRLYYLNDDDFSHYRDYFVNEMRVYARQKHWKLPVPPVAE